MPRESDEADSAERAQQRDIAKQAAMEAVHETFRLFGIDTRDQNQVNGLRDDWAFTRAQRMGVMQGDQAAGVGRWSIVAAVGGGAVGSALTWILSLWHGQPPAP